MKEIGGDGKKWKDIQHSWNERVNVIKISTVPKAIFGFNAIKTSMAFFTELFFFHNKFPKK